MHKPVNRRKGGINGVVSTEKDGARYDEITRKFIRDIRNGSEDAYYELITKEARRLKEYIYRYLQNVEDAEEATQDVFTYLWANRSELNFDTMPQLFKYLNIAAKTHALMILRERKNRRKYKDHLLASPNGYADSPDEILEMNQSRQIIQDAIKKMPKIRLMVYDMKQEQGLSYEEIAQRLNTSQSVIRYHFSLAMKDIKKALATAL